MHNQAFFRANETENSKTDLAVTSDKSNQESDRFSDSPLPVEVQQLILGYRKKNRKAGFKRIEDRLKSEHLVVVNRKQIRHVLKIHGLLGGHDSSFDASEKPAKGSRRFEAAYPGELYQMLRRLIITSRVNGGPRTLKRKNQRNSIPLDPLVIYQLPFLRKQISHPNVCREKDVLLLPWC